MTPLSWAGTPRDMRQALEAASGLDVTCAVMPGDNVGVEFRVIDGQKPWRKAFVLDKGHAVPDAFLAMLQSWRGEMLAKMRLNQVTPLLRAVIAEFGEGRVREALNEKLRGTVH